MRSQSTVVLTRSPADNEPLAADLRARGVTVIELPAVAVEPLADDRPLAAAIRALGPDDRLAFTSRAGVDAARRCVNADELRAPVAAIGEATARRCREWGVEAWTPTEATGAAVGRELALGSGSVLLARADRADDAIVRELVARGARVREIVAYRVVPRVDGDPRLARRAALAGAAVVVASPAAALGVASARGVEARRWARVLAIGPTTARAVVQIVGDEPRLLARLDADEIARAIGEEEHVGHR